MTNYLYSIQAKHALNILNGLKTIELRKHAPKPPFVMWIYVTKGKPYLKNNTNAIYYVDDKSHNYYWSKKMVSPMHFNGLVVAKCVVDRVEEIKSIEGCFHDEFIYTTYPKLLKQLCLSDNEVSNYGKGKPLYALHLSQVEILDKPLQVSEFFSYKIIHNKSTLTEPITDNMPFDKKLELLKQCESYTIERTPLTRAPQSYQKVLPPEVRK